MEFCRLRRAIFLVRSVNMFWPVGKYRSRRRSMKDRQQERTIFKETPFANPPIFIGEGKIGATRPHMRVCLLWSGRAVRFIQGLWRRGFSLNDLLDIFFVDECCMSELEGQTILYRLRLGTTIKPFGFFVGRVNEKKLRLRKGSDNSWFQMFSIPRPGVLGSLYYFGNKGYYSSGTN